MCRLWKSSWNPIFGDSTQTSTGGWRPSSKRKSMPPNIGTSFSRLECNAASSSWSVIISKDSNAYSARPETSEPSWKAEAQTKGCPTQSSTSTPRHGQTPSTPSLSWEPNKPIETIPLLKKTHSRSKQKDFSSHQHSPSKDPKDDLRKILQPSSNSNFNHNHLFSFTFSIFIPYFIITSFSIDLIKKFETYMRYTFHKFLSPLIKKYFLIEKIFHFLFVY